jgi:hypothetical protein
MGFFNKLDRETRRLLSQTDDFVNEEIPGGWYTVAAMAGGAGYGMNGGFGAGGTAGTAGSAGGAGGFSFLPSGEMTVFSPETAGATSGGSNFLTNLFAGSSELAPLNPTDYSRSVEMYPTSSGNIFEPSGMSPSQISSIQQMGDMSLLQDRMANRSRMPDFNSQMQQQTNQQLAQLNQDNQSGGMRKGQAIPQSLLSSLLDPANALKAYRPTLI